MKKIKKLFGMMLALLMIMVSSLSLVGCSSDIKKMQIKLEVYDYSAQKANEYTMDIDLYGHLAPETVKAIVSYVNDGYYNDALFYKMKDSSKQFMLGDLKIDGENIAQNEVKPNLNGEFLNGGTITEGGEALSSTAGTIGLWRSWTAHDGNYKHSSGTNSGSATWFIPTEEIADYKNWFCVFGQYDVEAENNKNAISALTAAFADSDNYVEYVIYYTGTEYENLEFHCVKASEFNADEIENLFEAKDGQLVCYNKYSVQIPTTPSGAFGAKIVEAKIV